MLFNRKVALKSIQKSAHLAIFAIIAISFPMECGAIERIETGTAHSTGKIAAAACCRASRGQRGIFRGENENLQWHNNCFGS